MKEKIDFFKFISIIRKKWLWIVFTSLFGFLASYGVTHYVLSPEYSSVTRLIVTQNYTENQPVELNDIQTNIQLINTYRDIINDPVVLDEVREDLSFSISEGELVENISMQIQNDSQVFGISVTGHTPEEAAEMTNLIASTFQQNVGSILNVENVSILSPARANPVPVSPRVLINIVVGTFLGFLSGILLCLGLYVIDKKVYDEETISELLGWTNLGSITEMSNKAVRMVKKEALQDFRDEKSVNEEADKDKKVYGEGTGHV